MPSVLANASRDMVENSPYPYIVIDDALPQAVFDRLLATYPDVNRLPPERKNQNNQRYNLWSKWGATEFEYASGSEDWKAFSELHTSEDFVRSVFDLFPDFRSKTSPDKMVVDSLGPNLSTRLKLGTEVSLSDVVPRVTVGVNTPVREKSSVRGAHTDSARKAYVGLLYFRTSEDDSTGGDLEIFNWKPGATREHWPVKVDRDRVDVAKNIEYKPNRLVLFMTTHNALHGVSPRSITPHWRNLVVISGWLPGVDHYDTDTMHGRLAGIKASVMARLRRALGRVKHRSGR